MSSKQLLLGTTLHFLLDFPLPFALACGRQKTQLNLNTSKKAEQPSLLTHLILLQALPAEPQTTPSCTAECRWKVSCWEKPAVRSPEVRGVGAGVAGDHNFHIANCWAFYFGVLNLENSHILASEAESDRNNYVIFCFHIKNENLVQLQQSYSALIQTRELNLLTLCTNTAPAQKKTHLL